MSAPDVRFKSCMIYFSALHLRQIFLNADLFSGSCIFHCFRWKRGTYSV